MGEDAGGTGSVLINTPPMGKLWQKQEWSLTNSLATHPDRQTFPFP